MSQETKDFICLSFFTSALCALIFAQDWLVSLYYRISKRTEENDKQNEADALADQMRVEAIRQREYEEWKETR